MTLTRSALEGAQERLDRSVRQLATLAATGIRNSQPRYAAVTHDSALHALLRVSRHDTAQAQRIIDRLRQPTDSGLPIELWDTTGRRIAFTGNDVPGDLALNLAGEREAPGAARRSLPTIRPVDSVQVGELYTEAGRTHFWIAMPVLDKGRPLGFVVQQRRIAANPQTDRTIRGLSGDSVAAFYHNADGTTWTTIGGMPTPHPAGRTPGSGQRSRPDSGPVLFSEAAIDGTPFVLAMETPRSAVLARPYATIRRLGLFAAVLTLAAGVIAWLLGRTVARPLERIATAAENVASGDYSTRVPTTGAHEIATLADRFNRMATQIGDSRAELERREEDLRQSAEAANAANKAKSDFLTAMSHELRTPLNAIGGYTELLELGVRGPITDDQRRDLERIRLSQQHLLNLIGGVLDLARIENGRVAYHLSAVDVGKLFDELEALVTPQANAKRHDLVIEDVEPGLAVQADAEKLRQILLNLASNAIRHTPVGTRITVSARATTDRVVEITVRDTGPGVPADRHDEVFEPFVQLDRSLTNSANGVGLGLAISRDLARGMGGDLTLVTNGTVGACFAVTLPRATV